MPDFEMFAGDTPVLGFTVTDSVSGEAINLTDAEIRWHAARTVTATALIEKALDAGVTIIAAAAGTFDVALAAADTEGLAGDYYHEAEVVDGDGNVLTVVAGTMTVKRTLIKPAP